MRSTPLCTPIFGKPRCVVRVMAVVLKIPGTISHGGALSKTTCEMKVSQRQRCAIRALGASPKRVWRHIRSCLHQYCFWKVSRSDIRGRTMQTDWTLLAACLWQSRIAARTPERNRCVSRLTHVCLPCVASTEGRSHARIPVC